ncbi:PDZ domain-containing protein [Hydrogenimonas sp.]
MNIRSPLFLLLFAIFLAAQGGGCFRFFPDSFVVIDGIPAFALSKDRFVALGVPSGVEIVAHDRFTGVSVFEKKASRPFYLMPPNPPLYYCPSSPAMPVTIASLPVSIYPGRLKERVEAKGALFGECCKFAALVDRGGFWFGAKSIKKVMRRDLHHGDIGARFEMAKNRIVVKASDPFVQNGLQSGDTLLEARNLKNPSLYHVRKMIDECKNGRTVDLRILRKDKKIAIKPVCFERVGGGKVSDTFLEHFGLSFDKRLHIETIDRTKEGYKKGLRRFDHLLAIDGVLVGDEADVQRILNRCNTKKQLPARMLWERSGFQFFLLPYSI